MTAIGTIRQLDYTVIFARDLIRMRRFYQRPSTPKPTP